MSIGRARFPWPRLHPVRSAMFIVPSRLLQLRSLRSVMCPFHPTNIELLKELESFQPRVSINMSPLTGCRRAQPYGKASQFFKVFIRKPSLTVGPGPHISQSLSIANPRPARFCYNRACPAPPRQNTPIRSESSYAQPETLYLLDIPDPYLRRLRRRADGKCRQRPHADARANAGR